MTFSHNLLTQWEIFACLVEDDTNILKKIEERHEDL